MVGAGMFDGSFYFGGEESAGASFLRHDGTVWTTDKDGPALDLLAAEIMPSPAGSGVHFRELTAEFGTRIHTYRRPSTPEEKAAPRETFAGGREGNEARP